MKRFILILLLPLLAGCQTLERGTTQKVQFTSRPVSAHCRLSSVEHGMREFDTPATLTLPRESTVYRLICDAPGLHNEENFGPEKSDSYGQTGPGDPTIPFRIMDAMTGSFWVFPEKYEVVLYKFGPVQD